MNNILFGMVCTLVSLFVSLAQAGPTILIVPSIPFDEQEALTQSFAAWATHETIGDVKAEKNEHFAAFSNYLEASMLSLKILLITHDQRHPYCSQLLLGNPPPNCTDKKGPLLCKMLPETVLQCAATKKLCEKTFRERKAVAVLSELPVIQEIPCIPLNGNQIQL